MVTMVELSLNKVIHQDRVMPTVNANELVGVQLRQVLGQIHIKSKIWPNSGRCCGW